MHKTATTVWVLLFFLTLALFVAAPVYALSLVVHVPEKYTDIEAGERFYFEIEIKYPENPSRKDLRLLYEIKKDDELIAKSKVLKAIETQASFVDFIVIPESAKTGLHIITVEVTDYEDLRKEVSASFYVAEGRGVQIRKYFLILLGAVIFVGLLGLIQIYIVRSIRKRPSRLTPHEYPKVPKRDRLFYEIISDTIMQMRYRVGEKAIKIAQNIDGLLVDKNNGKVLEIKKDPAKIIALIVLRYEQHLGKKISFAVRRADKETKQQLAPIDKNLVVVRKYFQ